MRSAFFFSNFFLSSSNFFLFFSSHDIHVPRMPHERFQGKSGTSFRGDAIVQLDWNVGEIMKTLDRLNLKKNTLVILSGGNIDPVEHQNLIK